LKPSQALAPAQAHLVLLVPAHKQSPAIANTGLVCVDGLSKSSAAHTKWDIRLHYQTQAHLSELLWQLIVVDAKAAKQQLVLVAFVGALVCAECDKCDNSSDDISWQVCEHMRARVLAPLRHCAVRCVCSEPHCAVRNVQRDVYASWFIPPAFASYSAL
jgi:hypothetical protein